MSEIEMLKQARKGTKSCTECRRRKVRCIRNPEDADTCRGCEDRGLQCVAQVFSSRPHRPPRLPSRHRIAQLESEVASLRKAVHNIQSKLGYQTIDIEPTSAQTAYSPGEDESDDDSNASDVIATEQPTHLRSLFQNDWLTSDMGGQDGQSQDRRVKASAHLLESARERLQRLVPSKVDVMNMARTASKWLDLVNAVLAQPFGLNSQQELLDSYDNMLKPDVDAMTLAAWLLDLALTAQQEPQLYNSPATSLNRFHTVSDFSRAVSDTVESALFAHDRLLGTVQGLGMAMHFLRLQISQGNFHKAWIRVRHCIALAELLGLSRLPQGSQHNHAGRTQEERSQYHRIQLWEFMCSGERLSGMLVNRPPISRRLEDPSAQPLIVNGIVQTQIYLKRLTDTTAKFHTLDDPVVTHGASAQAYASALELDRELRVLASETPKSWWEQDATEVKAAHLCQMLHYYFVMRVHLPFTVRQGLGEANIYSRLTCLNACEEVAQRYQGLRRLLPSGIFLSPIMDLQALTATVVLLLASHGGAGNNRIELQANNARVQETAAQVLRVMEEKSGDAAGSSFARQGANAIRSLNALLQRSDGAAGSNQLSLKVPLLGNINIRRNINPPPAASTGNQQPAQLMPGTGLWDPIQHPAAQLFDGAALNQLQVAPSTMQEQANWQWNPLSWSIEDNSFQDAFMIDNLDQLGMWQGEDISLQFNS
ncbi:putative C6 finger domain protein [Cladophialophora carrionii]|uniref:Putative C6 finger domain protein n=1 Tax=Cladophialophora carrionii TaxID=86049 RepID=A0A1C1CHM9_9EURO|nr:putative C6 finger domain protein [Cladophialophora carrionii]